MLQCPPADTRHHQTHTSDQRPLHLPTATMSNIRTIRRDTHSLYVKTGGYIFRPVRSRTVPPHPNVTDGDATQFNAGDKVPARHLSGNPLAKVGNETWASHGSYYDNSSQVPSDDIWDPAPNSRRHSQPSRTPEQIRQILNRLRN